jgi:hypothetical protein
MDSDTGLKELERMAEAHQDNTSLLEFVQDVKAILYHDPTDAPKNLNWPWLISEAYRRLRESNG